MTLTKGDALYSGKAKTVFNTEDKERFILWFRNDATAFNGVKQATLADKGKVNNYFNAFIMQYLESAGIKTHFVQRLDDEHSIVKKLEMLPIECVVRNVAAGGIAKRLGLEEGTPLNPPIFEFYLKDDALDDPMVNRSHIKTFGWATEDEIAAMETLTFKVNDILQPFFEKAGLCLIDYKLEFGRCDGELVLGDEFTPDGCRIWDLSTKEKFDKDRFRRDMEGDVIEFYRQAASRLGIQIP